MRDKMVLFANYIENNFGIILNKFCFKGAPKNPYFKKAF